QRLEKRFLTNLNERERVENSKIAISETNLHSQFTISSELTPWAVHLIDMVVDPHADYIGKTLMEVQWREKYGVNVAYIKRGDNQIYTPGRNIKLLPFDHVGIIST